MFAPRTNTSQFKPNNHLFGGATCGFVQPKLNIGSPKDKYEIEADKAADQIVSKSKEGAATSSFIAPSTHIQKQSEEEIQTKEKEDTIVQEKPVVENITPLIQRKNSEEEEIIQNKCSACAAEEKIQKEENEETVSKVQMKASPQSNTIQTKCGCEDKETTIQRKGEGASEEKKSILETTLQKMQSNQDFESKLADTKGKGSKMDAQTQSEMESGFGADFSNVNIHTDDQAAQMSNDIGAQAFTNGNDIYFNQGKYNPQSEEGKHLLAHELTHTLQQGASTTDNNVQRIELPGFVQDGLDALSGTYDNAVDAVADGMYDLGEALGVNEEVLEAYEMAEDVYDAATEYLLEARDWLLSQAGQAARRLVEALGGGMIITEDGTIIITFPRTCPIPAEEYEVDLPPMSEEATYPVAGIAVGSGFLYGAIGISGTFDPDMAIEVGPFCFEGAEIQINPVTGHYSAVGNVSATTSVSLGAHASAGLRGDMSFLGVLPIGGVPVPIDIPLLGLEGGIEGVFRGIGVGQYVVGGLIEYSNGSLIIASSDQLNIGLAANLMSAAYAQLDVLDFEFCKLYWDLFDWQGETAAFFNLTSAIVFGPDSSVTLSKTVTVGELPFDQLEASLDTKSFKDKCLGKEEFCDFMEDLELLPTQNGGTWENYGAGPELPGPKTVHTRDPQRASQALCRGACGPDCITCESQDTFRYVDPETEETWEYINYEDCPTHQGCKVHDAGFDWAAEKGETGGPQVVIYPWHMAANIECACNYSVLQCTKWIGGYVDDESQRLLFADSVTKISGENAGDSLKEKVKAIEVYFFDKDPELHVLTIEVDRSDDVEIMMASDEKGPVKEKIQNELDNDETDSAEEEEDLRTAEEIRKDLDELIEKHLKETDEDAQETDSIRDDIVSELQALAVKLESGGIDHQAELPLSAVTFSMSNGKPQSVKADPLTNRAGNTAGSEPKVDPVGWELVNIFKKIEVYIDTDDNNKHKKVTDENRDMVKRKGYKTYSKPDNWIRFHILNENLHGPGVIWNLLTSHGSDNNPKYLKNIEEKVKTPVLEDDPTKVAFFEIAVNYRSNEKIIEEDIDSDLDAGAIKELYSHLPESLVINAGLLKKEGDDEYERDDDNIIFKDKLFKFDHTIDVTLAPGTVSHVLINSGHRTNGPLGLTRRISDLFQRLRGSVSTVATFVDAMFNEKKALKIPKGIEYLTAIYGALEKSTSGNLISLFEGGVNADEKVAIANKIASLREVVSGKPTKEQIAEKFAQTGYSRGDFAKGPLADAKGEIFDVKTINFQFRGMGKSTFEKYLGGDAQVAVGSEQNWHIVKRIIERNISSNQD